MVYVGGVWWPQLSPVRVSPGAENEWEVDVEFGLGHPEDVHVCIVEANELGLQLIRYYRKVALYRDEIVRRAALCYGDSEENVRLRIAPSFCPISMTRLPHGLDVIEDRITVRFTPADS
jgi:hypothetical protein